MYSKRNVKLLIYSFRQIIFFPDLLSRWIFNCDLRKHKLDKLSSQPVE